MSRHLHWKLGSLEDCDLNPCPRGKVSISRDPEPRTLAEMADSIAKLQADLAMSAKGYSPRPITWPAPGAVRASAGKHSGATYPAPDPYGLAIDAEPTFVRAYLDRIATQKKEVPVTQIDHSMFTKNAVKVPVEYLSGAHIGSLATVTMPTGLQVTSTIKTVNARLIPSDEEFDAEVQLFVTIELDYYATKVALTPDLSDPIMVRRPLKRAKSAGGAR